MPDADVVSVVQRHAVTVDLEAAAAPLLQMIDPAATVVLIGEATHGTREFYPDSRRSDRALIRERGFGIVAVEADWPDAYRANAWVRLAGADETAESALSDFTDFLDGCGVTAKSCGSSAGCMRRTARATRPPGSGSTAWTSTACIGPWHVSSNTWTKSIPQRRGGLVRDTPASTPLARTSSVTAIQRASISADPARTRSSNNSSFTAGRRSTRRAMAASLLTGPSLPSRTRASSVMPRYYRAMSRGGAESWNLRDRHMMATLEALMDRATSARRPARAVVWAHVTRISATPARPAWRRSGSRIWASWSASDSTTPAGQWG